MKRPFHDTPPMQPPPPRGERRVALVIGNGRYAHSTALTNPARDAEAMAGTLARLGFDVVKGIDVDLRAIGDVQAAFEDKLRGNPEVALLFYAGHGLQVEGRNYLLPIDAQINSKAHLASRALLFNDVLEPMAQHAGASLIFLDACRDNPFARNLLRAFDPGTARKASDALPSTGPIRGGLARIEKVAGTFIAYATAPDTVAYDGKGQNSRFTGALLKHIETPGLSVADMMIDVRNSVIEETSGRQEPWDQSSLRSRFYFVEKRPEPPPLPRNQAAEEWVAIQHTSSLAVLAQFRERNPDWSAYADARADEIRAADEARRRALEAEQRQREAQQERVRPPAVGPAVSDHRTPSPVQPIQVRSGQSGSRSIAAIGIAGAVALAALVAYFQPWGGASAPPPGAPRVAAVEAPTAPLTASPPVAEPAKPAVVQPKAPALTTPRSHWDCKSDASWCKVLLEMRVLPTGSYLRGSSDAEIDELVRTYKQDYFKREAPQRRVTINHTVAMAKYEATFELWDLCHVERKCTRKPEDQGWGRGKRPVINVSWNEITTEFLPWLNAKLGISPNDPGRYRLPTEAEWEFATRAGTTGDYSFDGPITAERANYNADYSHRGSPKGTYRGRTVAVDEAGFPLNPWGLAHVHGNVWEWVQDCFAENYKDAPTDGNAVSSDGCVYRVLRGGGWFLNPRTLRSADRGGNQPGDRNLIFGFRLARTLPPSP